MQQQTIFLSIKNGGKGVPYGGADEDRPDGSRNFGFKNLRSNPEEIEVIPEAQNVPALKNALRVLNAPESPFFTIGCEKALQKNDLGYQVNGYLEFAFNYCELVADAQFYFKLFFDFNQWYWSQQQQAVQFVFELEGAQFLDANVAGLTMSVWIATSSLPTEELARSTWEAAIDLIVASPSLYSVPDDNPYRRIY